MNFVAYFIVVLVISAGVLVGIASGFVSVRDALGWFVPLIGTFTGALFAFRLQEHREKTKIHEDRKKCLDEALFVLSARFNELFNIRRSLEPYRSMPEGIRALSLPAMKGADLSDLRFSFKDLAFLSTVSSPRILLDLVVEESRFDASIEVLKIRAEQHVHLLQPAMAENKVGEGLWTAEKLEAVLGEYLFRSAVTNTNQVFDHVYRTVDSCLGLAQELYHIAKDLYKDRRFILVSSPEESSNKMGVDN